MNPKKNPQTSHRNPLAALRTALVDQEQFGKVTFVIRTRHGIGFRGLASCLILGRKAFQNTALLRDVWLFRYVCLQNFSRHDRKAARQPKNFL